jgi:hypothetical protein
MVAPKFELVASRDFMNLDVNTGLLLEYLAGAVRDIINDRTNRGISATGAAFVPYPEVSVVGRLAAPVVRKNGNVDEYERDERGRYVLHAVPRSTAALWSELDLPPGQHMRENVGVHPKVPRSSTRSVSIYPDGARAGLTHYKRSAYASGISRHPAMRYTLPHRPWLGVIESEWTALLRDVDMAGALAFVEKRGREIEDAEAKRAKRKQEIDAKRRERAVKRTEAQTRRMADKRRAKLAEMGYHISDDASLEEYDAAIAYARQLKRKKRRR